MHVLMAFVKMVSKEGIPARALELQAIFCSIGSVHTQTVRFSPRIENRFLNTVCTEDAVFVEMEQACALGHGQLRLLALGRKKAFDSISCNRVLPILVMTRRRRLPETRRRIPKP